MKCLGAALSQRQRRQWVISQLSELLGEIGLKYVTLSPREASPVALIGTPANARNLRDCVQSLGQEDPLEKGTATHSSILAWRSQWAEKPGRL